MINWHNSVFTAFILMGATTAHALCQGDAPLLIDSELNAGAHQEVQVETGATRAWAFTLSAPAMIEITATNDAADPFIALYDDTGVNLYENDDFDGLNARIKTDDVLPVGRYCLEVRDIDGGDEVITVGLTTTSAEAAQALAVSEGRRVPDRVEGDMITDAGLIVTKFTHNFRQLNEAQWLFFTVEEESLFDIRARSYDGVDTVLRIFDEEGRKIEENDDYGASKNSRIVIELTPGQYALSSSIFDGSETFGETQFFVQRYIRATE